MHDRSIGARTNTDHRSSVPAEEHDDASSNDVESGLVLSHHLTGAPPDDDDDVRVLGILRYILISKIIK
jgi:hypothetical protein